MTYYSTVFFDLPLWSLLLCTILVDGFEGTLALGVCLFGEEEKDSTRSLVAV